MYQSKSSASNDHTNTFKLMLNDRERLIISSDLYQKVCIKFINFRVIVAKQIITIKYWCSYLIVQKYTYLLLDLFLMSFALKKIDIPFTAHELFFNKYKIFFHFVFDLNEVLFRRITVMFTLFSTPWNLSKRNKSSLTTFWCHLSYCCFQKDC